jgi:hypothetical protein
VGEDAGAVEDAGWVLEIISEQYHPVMAEVVRGEEYAGAEEDMVDLRDQLAKALKRMAKAWKGREKWTVAGKD